MKSLFHAFPKALSPEYCDSIIERAKELPEQPGKIGNNTTDDNVRRSTVKWIHPTDHKFRDVHEMIWQKAHEVNMNLYGLDINYNGGIQYTIYDEGVKGHYDWHRDVHWPDSTHYARKISIVIQLSHQYDYEGGDFEIDEKHVKVDKEEIRQRGTIITFPSFVSHRVTPVTKGTRHSLVSWIQGPNWR